MHTENVHVSRKDGSETHTPLSNSELNNREGGK